MIPITSDRKEADEQLKVEIGQKTAPWGYPSARWRFATSRFPRL